MPTRAKCPLDRGGSRTPLARSFTHPASLDTRIPRGNRSLREAGGGTVRARDSLAVKSERTSLLGPADYSRTDLVSFSRFPAVADFLTVMRELRPDFSLTPHDLPCVAQICAYADSSRDDLALIAQVAHDDGLGSVLDALTAEEWPARFVGTLKRHSPHVSLADLSQAQQTALACAYHLKSGFGAEAFREISGLENSDDVLRDLVSTDYLTGVDASAAGLRYVADKRFRLSTAVLSAVRCVATTQPQAVRFQQAHATYFGKVARAHLANLGRRHQASAFRAMNAESANIEKAFAFLIRKRFRRPILDVLEILIPFWMRYGETFRARRLLAMLLDQRLTMSPDNLRRVNLLAADAFSRMGEVETSAMLRSADVADLAAWSAGAVGPSGRTTEWRTWPEPVASFALLDWGALDISWQHYAAGQPEEAIGLARRVLASATLRGDDVTAGAALLRLAAFSNTNGDEATARMFIGRALVRLRGLGSRVMIGEISELIGNQLSPCHAARAHCLSRIIGALYGESSPGSQQRFSGFPIGDKEEEILEVITYDEFLTDFRDSGRASLVDLLVDLTNGALGEIARCATSEPQLPSTGSGRPLPERAPNDPANVDYEPKGELTAREWEVAVLVGAGMTNKQIARRLKISEWTVVNHMRHVMRKLRANSRVQVATWIHASGAGLAVSSASSQPAQSQPD